MATMNISLPETLREFVDQQVARAGYGSVSDYARELIRQDQERQAERHLAWLIQEGLESGAARPVEARYWAAKRPKLRTAASKRPARWCPESCGKTERRLPDGGHDSVSTPRSS